MRTVGGGDSKGHIVSDCTDSQHSRGLIRAKDVEVVKVMANTRIRRGLLGALVVTLAGAPALAEGQIPHPQDEAIARGSRPYRSEDVSFANERAHIDLAGTFSVPDGEGPFPAVLLIAASGPEGRDEEVAGHRVFVVLAGYLLRQGVAVLRYDKRGVRASTGDLDKASFDDLVSDAATAFRYLKTRPEVNMRCLGIIGHSEGGSIAPAVAASDKDVAFVVAMAGSGLSGEFRITESQVYMAKEQGASSEQQERIRVMCQQIFRTVAATSDDVAARVRIETLIRAAIARNTLKPEEAEPMRELLTPQFVRQELQDNPVSYLARVHVPVLAFVGSLDRIVPAGPYVEAMRPALAGIPGSKVLVLPGLNHVMQTAQTGSPREFGSIEESISPLALKTIGDWIAEQVRSHSR